MPQLVHTKYEHFARFYVSRGRNAQRAALAAGMSPQNAYRLLSREDVAERIRELSEANLKLEDINARRVVLELGRVAFSDARDLYGDDGNLIPMHMLSDDAAATVAGFEVERKSLKVKREPRVDLVSGEPVLDENGEQVFDEIVVETVTQKVRRFNKDSALTTLAKHFKVIGDEGDGVNALASALADRLKSARKRATKGASDEG